MRFIKTFRYGDETDLELKANQYAKENNLNIVSCSITSYTFGTSPRFVLAVVYEQEEKKS